VEPLSERLEARLREAPRGVQVLMACAAGQYSFELSGPAGGPQGGAFLAAVNAAAQKGELPEAQAKPEEPLPVAVLAKSLTNHTGAAVRGFLKGRLGNAGQTPTLAGEAAEKELAYDPALIRKRQALTLDIRHADPDAAPRAQVERMLEVVLKVPPLLRTERPPLLLAGASYPVKQLERYRDDGKDTNLRTLVREAAALLARPAGQVPDRLPLPPTNDQQRAQWSRQLQDRQVQVAVTQAALAEALANLEAARGERDKERRLWQANYDYVVARLRAESAILVEYNLLLGKLRKDDVPAYDAKIHQGFRVAARGGNPRDREAETLLQEARLTWLQLARDNPGTPWEVLGRRERLMQVGLELVPY
jgi:hypothetical protein